MVDQYNNYVKQAKEFAENIINKNVSGLESIKFGPISCIYGESYEVKCQHTLLSPYIETYYHGSNKTTGIDAIVHGYESLRLLLEDPQTANNTMKISNETFGTKFVLENE